MTKKTNLPPAPSHLSPEAADLWRAIVSDYALEPADLAILETACVQRDRATAARQTIAESKTGPYILDRFGQLKEHPGVAIEQNATRLFLASLRQLGLGLDGEESRLPDPVAPRWRA